MPLLIGELLEYFKASEEGDGATAKRSVGEAALYGLLISLLFFVCALCHHLYFHSMFVIALRIKISLQGLLYKKVNKKKFIIKLFIHQITARFFVSQTLEMRLASAEQATGKILNLMSSELMQLEDLPYVALAPLQTAAVVYILFYKVSSAFLSGVFILALLIPLQILSGKIYSHFK